MSDFLINILTKLIENHSVGDVININISNNNKLPNPSHNSDLTLFFT